HVSRTCLDRHRCAACEARHPLQHRLDFCIGYRETGSRRRWPAGGARGTALPLVRGGGRSPRAATVGRRASRRAHDGRRLVAVAALREAGIAGETAVIVTGDHGFQDVERTVQVNEILAGAGLGGCRTASAEWRATAHVTGGSAAIFVKSATDGGAAEAALRRE